MEEKTIGNYRVLRKIGAGGMGSVYLASDMSLEREVAIKIISPELARVPHLMARFRVEAIAQARLNHTNIVTIHSFEHQGDTYYIVMEYVSGKTLKHIIKEKGKIPVRQALTTAAHILEGLSYAHARGVLHRDIKPANIFITADNTVKIGDFGIAKVKGIDGLTRVGSTLGTILYSSPEQLRGEKMEAPTDIYSLGVTLYEMVVGHPPFTSASGSNHEIQLAHLEKIPPIPSSLENTVPPAVDAIIMKSLAKSPRDRYGTAREFKAAVDRLLEDAPVKKKIIGKAKEPKVIALPQINIPKIKLPKIKLPAMDSSFLKKISLKMPGPILGTAGSAARGFDRRKLLVILIPLLILLFIVIALADHLPGKRSTASFKKDNKEIIKPAPSWLQKRRNI